MKKITIWATALTMSLSLFSCDKERRELEPSLTTPQEQAGQEDNVPHTLYTATSEIGNYDIAQDKADEGLRASVICKGYRKPEIDVSAEEFRSNNIKAYWTIVGQGVNTSGTVSNFLDAVPSQNNAPTLNSLALTKENSIRKLKMYAQVANNFDVKNKFAMLTLDGTLRDERYIDYNFATRTNYELKGLHNNDKLTGYHLPIMTEIMPFDKVFKTKTPVHYQPRGVMIAMSIINNSCQAVNIKRIEFEDNNALWFEGSFDTWMAEDGTNLQAASSAGVSTSYKAKFIGAKGDEIVRYNVYNGTTAGYKIDKELGQTIDDAVKEAATKFFVWGYPRDNSKQLKFKIIYTDYGQTTEKTKVCAVDAPNLGFQDGYAYQLPILLAGSARIGGVNPLDFVAEYDVNNAPVGQKALRTSHSLPKSNLIVDLLPDDVGYYNWNEAIRLFDGSNPALENYYLPNVEQWESIYPASDFVRNDGSEECQIGNLPKTTYYYTSSNVEEGGFHILYALRFKCTKWESAWRYSYEGPEGNKKLIIKAVGGLQNSGIKLSDIQNDTFFSNHNATKRVFSPYGRYDINDNPNNIKSLTWGGSFWSSTPKSDFAYSLDMMISPSARYLDILIDYMFNGYINSKTKGYTVRPFYKVLPKK